MRIVLLTDTFSRNMGYLENMLPKYLARAGAEVHVIASNLSPYYWQQSAQEAYRKFSRHSRCEIVEEVSGFTLHVLGHRRVLGHISMAGLLQKLRDIRPDIVQTAGTTGWTHLQAALYKPRLRYKLFTACHYHASVFPLAQARFGMMSSAGIKCLIARILPGRLASLATEKCYAISDDCADVAARFFGVPKNKISVCALGVDMELFYPINSRKDEEERRILRRHLGFAENEIVCVYTGRFTGDKNPALLARAVEALQRRGNSYRGLFVGEGEQKKAIESCASCVTHPFVDVAELGKFYRAADIGVWPTQESMSMLDAAACGLPIIANDTMCAPERLDGNGLSYRLNDFEDLKRALVDLRDLQVRERMGMHGARKMAQHFSWEGLGRKRLLEYESALRVGDFAGGASESETTG